MMNKIFDLTSLGFSSEEAIADMLARPYSQGGADLILPGRFYLAQ